MVAYKRLKILRFDWETFGVLENWSLRRRTCLREVVAYKRLEILRFDRETLGILHGKLVAEETSSLTRGGRLEEVTNIEIWPGNLWHFTIGKLVAEETCSLTRGGRND